MGKILCVGGFLHGVEVDFRASEYAPISVDDHRDYYFLSPEEILANEEPAEKYFLYTSNIKDFYIWNNDDSLKKDLLNKYINHQL